MRRQFTRPHIDYHVRQTALPKPGDSTQVKRLSGRVTSQQLDRSKPRKRAALRNDERLALVAVTPVAVRWIVPGRALTDAIGRVADALAGMGI
jgi:hypothetical protein